MDGLRFYKTANHPYEKKNQNLYVFFFFFIKISFVEIIIAKQDVLQTNEIAINRVISYMYNIIVLVMSFR